MRWNLKPVIIVKQYSIYYSYYTGKNWKNQPLGTVFSGFSGLLPLYNAVSGKTYTDPEQLQIVTLENAVYMGMKNDLA